MDTTMSLFFVVMNRDSFEALNPEQQAAVTKAGEETSHLANAVQLREAAKGIDAFGAMPGKTLIRLTEAEAAAFDALSAKAREGAVAQVAGQGLPAEQVVTTLAAD
jgi:TRAP-type C4-dicarboxylate transport system substrate-binding protein